MPLAEIGSSVHAPAPKHTNGPTIMARRDEAPAKGNASAPRLRLSPFWANSVTGPVLTATHFSLSCGQQPMSTTSHSADPATGCDPHEATSDGTSAERLFVRLYHELLQIAEDQLRREPRDHTLQPSAVVNEAYLRLVGAPELAEDERTAFIGVAARAMHQVLVDHARRRHAAKRGGGWRQVTLSEGAATAQAQSVDILILQQALAKLQARHPRGARIVELRFFGGLDERAIARELGVSRTTVQGDWRWARAWLHREFDEGGDE